MRSRKRPVTEFWTREEVLAYFGNISVATLYRGIRKGWYPRQVRVGKNSVRWRKDDVIAARAKLNDRRVSA